MELDSQELLTGPYFALCIYPSGPEEAQAFNVNDIGVHEACTRTCWKHDIRCVFFFPAQPGRSGVAWVNASGCTRGSLEAAWWTCVKCLCHIKEGETILAFTCRPSSSLLLSLHLFPVELNTGTATATGIPIGLFFPAHNKSQMMKICVFSPGMLLFIAFFLFFCYFSSGWENASQMSGFSQPVVRRGIFVSLSRCAFSLLWGARSARVRLLAAVLF